MENIKSVAISHLSVFILGVIKVTLIPSMIGVSDFGYWQIYVFYTSFVGFFSLGFHDGLYLRYGGYEKEKIPLPTIRKALFIYSLLLFIFAVIFVFFYMNKTDWQSKSLMILVSCNVVIMGLLGVITQMLQATNQLKGYSMQNIPDKIFFIAALFYLYSTNNASYLSLATIDTIGKLALLIVMLFIHRDIFFGSTVEFRAGLSEYWENVKCGSKLMIANTLGMLILGAGRLVIEYHGSIEHYAEYSFASSISNLMLIGTTALGIVLYPTLKRLPESNYLQYYIAGSRLIFFSSSLLLLFYFPAVLFIKTKYGQYVQVIPYLNIFFVATFLQSKIQLLNSTYLKLLRRESQMVMANLLVFVLVFIPSYFSYLISKNIIFIPLILIIIICCQSIFTERYLRKIMGDSSLKWIWLELLTPLCFLFITLFLPLTTACLLSLFLLIVLYIYLRNDIRSITSIIIDSK